MIQILQNTVDVSFSVNVGERKTFTPLGQLLFGLQPNVAIYYI